MTFRIETEGPTAFFPDEIERDDWILFHGTSGSHEAEVDASGLQPQASKATEEMIDRVLAVVDALNWMPPAAAPLKSYSKGFDLKDGKSPLFLAATSLRAAKYASRYNAGGEKLSLLRRTIRQLHDFSVDADWRLEVQQEQQQKYAHMKRSNMHPEELDRIKPRPIDLDWLRSALAGLADVSEMAEDAWRNHDFGVVYALRFSPQEVPQLRWNGGMGVICENPVRSDAIVSKTRVANDFEGDAMREDPYLFDALTKKIITSMPR